MLLDARLEDGVLDGALVVDPSTVLEAEIDDCTRGKDEDIENDVFRERLR